MTNKKFVGLAATIFSIVCVMHILRLINGWEIQIGGFSVPTWASVVAAVLAGYLAHQGFRLKK